MSKTGDRGQETDIRMTKKTNVLSSSLWIWNLRLGPFDDAQGKIWVFDVL